MNEISRKMSFQGLEKRAKVPGSFVETADCRALGRGMLSWLPGPSLLSKRYRLA